MDIADVISSTEKLVYHFKCLNAITKNFNIKVDNYIFMQNLRFYSYKIVGWHLCLPSTLVKY